MRCRLSPLLILAAAVCACGSSSESTTRIVVAIWSDYSVPGQLDGLRVETTGANGSSNRTMSLRKGPITWPVQIDLVPLGSSNTAFTVKVVGLLGSKEVVSQTAGVAFVPGKSMLLKIILNKDCEGAHCPSEYTCAKGQCSQPVAGAPLTPYDPNQTPIPPDAAATPEGRDGASEGMAFVDGTNPPAEAGALDLYPGEDGVAENDLVGNAGDVPDGRDGEGSPPITGSGGGGGAGGGDGSGGSPGFDVSSAETATADGAAADLRFPDAAASDLPVPDASGTCGTDLDCPSSAPVCLRGTCARCTSQADCTGNAAGPLCESGTGRCVECLSTTDCTNSSKPLCATGGKCTACTYATLPNGCCADTDCGAGGVGSTGKCEASHTCSYTCDATHRLCTDVCIPTSSSSCCTDSECTSGGDGTVGSCDAAHKCNYRCDASHRECNGVCITGDQCCADPDCPSATLPNECQYQGCLAGNACGPKGRPNTVSCAGSTGMCDGNGNCLVCAANQYRCTGTELQVCNAAHTQFTKVSDCPQNLCDATSGHCHVCIPGLSCDATDPHKLITCSADGMTATPTTDSTKFCLNGAWVGCRNVNDCTQPSNPCIHAACTANSCVTSAASAGTSCAGNGTCDSAAVCHGPTGRPSCPTGLATCQGKSCCDDSLVLGGSFPMGLGSGTAPDACPSGLLCDNASETPEHSATLADFYMDTFEVTVGRFREFYKRYGTSPSSVPPADGAGANPHIAGSGWKSATWNSLLPASQAALATALGCPGGGTPTWPTAVTADTEVRAINCVSWYLAFAFCIWDGGRLPTEAEWEYAAAGGATNQLYPWGSPAPDSTRANYFGHTGTALISVGSFPAGAGPFGQLDLAGGMNEWVLDWFSDTWYDPGAGNPCSNCANLTSGNIYRGRRGGGWFQDKATNLRVAARSRQLPEDLIQDSGFRCVRDRS